MSRPRQRYLSICSRSASLWVSPGKVLEMVARAHIRRDTTVYMDYGELEMFSHAATQESMISTAHLLLT